MAINKIKVPSDYTVVAVVMTEKPESMVLLYPRPFTDDQLENGDIYDDVPRFQLYFGNDSLAVLKKEVERRWPDATIYRVVCLGVGRPIVWH